MDILVEMTDPKPVHVELRCRVCGYGVIVVRLPLPVCPMCRSRSWTRRSLSVRCRDDQDGTARVDGDVVRHAAVGRFAEAVQAA